MTQRDPVERWIGEVPADWEVVRARRLFKIRKRIAGRPGLEVLSVTQRGVVPKDLTSGEGQLAADYSKYQLVREGDFVMNHMDLVTGYIDVSRYSGVTSPDYRVFVPMDASSMERRFFLHFFQLCYHARIFFPFGQGSAQVGRWRLPRSAFRDFPVPVPPITQQRAIADFLDRKTAAIDALIEKKERLIALLEEKRQALITQAVTKGLDPNVPMKDSGIEWLGDIPAHWDLVSLRRVGEVGQGDAFAHAIQGQETGDFPWFKVGDMNRPGNEVEMLAADNYVDSDVAAAARARVFPPGTVIFPRVGAALLTNKRRLLVEPSIVDDNTYGVVPNERIRPGFLYFVLLLVDMGMLCSAGLVPTVTFSAVKEIPVPLPPVGEQEAVIQHAESEVARISDLASRTWKSIHLLREYRQAVITAAVTGKLDVTSEEAA